MAIQATLLPPPTLQAEMQTPATLQAELAQSVTIVTGAKVDYTGPYTFTPSQQEQTVATAQKTLAQDIVIAPIPHNYGLITYNGFSLTVS